MVSVALMLVASFWYYPKWKQEKTEATLSWDVSGYYWYLPSIFIYNDLTGQSFKDSILNRYAPTNQDFQQAMKVENGNYVMKYSSGMAVMYLPFFAAAHIMAKPLGYPPDGFSPPYQLAIQLGGILVSILGLWYLRRLLLLYYDDKVVAIALLMLAAGSNYLNYAAIDCGMSHCWLFTLYVLLLLNTHHFYREYKAKHAIRIGLLVGLATLTRPTDILSCMIPLLWGMEGISITSIRERMALLVSRYRLFLLAVACAAPVVAIQLIYWKYASGHWMVYSYGGQEFSWKHPHIYDYTLSYRSGWLVYSPIMVFAFLGLLPFAMRGKNKVAIIAFFLLNYYVVTAWDIWWYGGRAMVQSYPVLMFPIAAAVEVAIERRWLAVIFWPVVLLLTYYNLWLTVQYHGGKLYDSESMTKRYFWRVVGRWSAPEGTIFLRDNADLYEEQPMNSKVIWHASFAQDTGSAYVADTTTHTRYLRLDKDHQESPVYAFAIDRSKGDRLRIEATFRSTEKEWDTWKMTQMIAELTDSKNKNAVVKQNLLRVYRVLNRQETRTIALDMDLPRKPFDSVHVRFWNAGTGVEIHVLDMQAIQFSE
ncbi:hypothetical protein GCM10023093_31510 [Nemorincola caseinilytica]|uniref:Glycosyltransferase RgtA/B/C/D-like domain-containing protein n=2 Tax=Nemorincola caseinilytica TaxID=2054315 RepID=A0ABP8NNU8_9BACT